MPSKPSVLQSPIVGADRPPMEGLFNIALVPVVETVSVEVADAPATFTVAGENVQVTWAGIVLQAKFTAPVNPPLGATVNVNVADWPAWMVAIFGDTVIP